MKKLKEMREKRGKLIEQARAILDKADTDGRSLTAEERANYEKAFKDQEELKAQIELEERQLEAEREAAARAADDGRNNRSKGEGGAGAPKEGRASEEYRAAFDKFLRHGPDGMTGDERRALQSTTNPEGGYMVASEQFVTTLIKAVDDAVFIRARATIIQLPAAMSLGAASLDADPDDGDWTTELGTGSEDSTMKFGKRELSFHPVAKRIKLSKTLVARSPGIEALVTQRLGYKFAITQEKAYLTGTGVGRPLGVFVASNNGIPTSRDVSAGNTATEIRGDGLISAKYALKQQYRARASWLFHRDAMAQISKLKDGNGQYLWRAGLVAGEPDRVLNMPVDESEYVPNTFTTGLYVGMLADWTNYWITDAMNLQMQRLEELYAEANQVGFIARYEGDGMPVLAEAFSRVKLA